jgi:hypothetical protein
LVFTKSLAPVGVGNGRGVPDFFGSWALDSFRMRRNPGLGGQLMQHRSLQRASDYLLMFSEWDWQSACLMIFDEVSA